MRPPPPFHLVNLAGGGALAIAGGRIVSSPAPGSERVDAGGRLAIPGFRDAHTHLSAGSVDLSGADLRGLDEPSLARRLREEDAALPAGATLRGFGWREIGAVRRAASGIERPLALARGDGHAAWTQDGLVEEEDWTRLRAALPLPSLGARVDALRRALREANARGITRLADVAETGSVEAWEALREGGELTARVSLWIPADLPREEAEELRLRHPPDDPWLAVTHRKVFLDGTLGAGTADLEREGARRASIVLDRRESPYAFHAIGDGAVRRALDAILRIGGAGHRVEHAEIVAREDLDRFAGPGVVASMQPAHLALDDPLLGADRALAFPWAELLARGVPLEFGSDWPVAPLDPRVGLGECLSAGRGIAAISLDAALVAYGTAPKAPEPGAAADLVLLDGDDPLRDPPRAVWVGGRAVFGYTRPAE